MKSLFDARAFAQSIRTALLCLSVFGVLTVVSAYTDPTQAPPQGGTPPINVGPATQKKEGSLSLGVTAASPAQGGSLVLSRNVYVGTETSGNQSVFFGELGRAQGDFSSRQNLGVGWQLSSGFVGMFGADWRVMDSVNTALLKNVFANDYWIGAAQKWASQLAVSGPAPVTPNLQQVTNAGNVTTQTIAAGDFVSGGSNSWLWHTPDDGRTSTFFASGANGANWNWGSSFEFRNNGDVNANDVWLRKANRWASEAPPPPRFGNWEQRSPGTTYTAATDGFVTAYVNWTLGDQNCYSRLITGPGTIQDAHPNGDSPQVSQMMPVRKGDGWRHEGNCSGVTIYWLPFGS